MTIREWNKRNRYRMHRAIYRNRQHIGWVVIAVICCALWFVNHENQRLSAENLELRLMYTETHKRLVSANRANEDALLRYQALRDRQIEIIDFLKAFDCANKR